MEVEFNLVVDLMPAEVTAARAKTDEVRQQYADALNAVAAEFNPKLSAAFTAQLQAEQDIRVSLLQSPVNLTPPTLTPVDSQPPTV